MAPILNVGDARVLTQLHPGSLPSFALRLRNEDSLDKYVRVRVC